jgi:MYXO-CTERM domain-containing protein
VPLGVGFGADAAHLEDLPDGVIDDIVVHSADLAGQFPEEGTRRFVLALAVDMKSGLEPAWKVTGGQLYFVDTFSGTRTLAAFMPPPAVTYDAQARHLDVSGLAADLDLLQLVFSRPDARAWRVLVPASGSSLAYDLPDAPAAGDRAETAGVMAIRLAGGVDYQDLVAFNDTNADDLFGLAAEFVISTQHEILPEGCGTCASAPRRAGRLTLAALTLLLLAALPRRRRHR